MATAQKMKNKVIYNGTVLIDLTTDSVTADKILVSYTAHDKAGNAITGTCDYDVNSKDATVGVAEILKGKTAYAAGKKLTGTMPNNGAVSLTIDTVTGVVKIPQGYHDGSGTVKILTTEQAKLIAENIKQGITILGITGTLEPSSAIKVTTKTVTPSANRQTITAGAGYDYMSEVTVEAIPYAETDNPQGGVTVTIG